MRNVSNWLVDLSAIGPKISDKFNEVRIKFYAPFNSIFQTISRMGEEFDNFKEKLNDVSASIKERADQIWNQVRESASNFRNNTAEWIHEEHPEVENTWGKIKTGFNNFGEKVRNSWNSFLNLFRSTS